MWRTINCSLNCCPIWRRYGCPFIGGTWQPMGPWIRGNSSSRPSIQTDLDTRQRWTLKGDGAPTFEAETERWARETSRPTYRWGRSAPPCVLSSWSFTSCLGWWIWRLLSQFHHGWSWFALIIWSWWSVFWLNPTATIKSRKLMELVNLKHYTYVGDIFWAYM